MSLLLCNHLIDIGRSPLSTVQVREAGSPEFNASSPTSKGKIWGGTEERQMHSYLF